MIKLQDFFAGHPRLQEQFPGGVVQFAQLIANLPEEELQDLLVNAQIGEERAAQGALPHGEMPGGLPGDNFVQLDFGGEADIDIEMEDPTAAGAREGMPAANDAPVLDEDEGEDDEFEEVGIFLLPLLSSVLNPCQIAPLPIRVLRNLVGRFWGGSNAEEEDSSEDGSHEEAELDGVD
jgi:hypothetical protein